MRAVGSPTTGEGLRVLGGSTSGDGIKVTTTSGHGLNLAPVGTSMHGILSTGGDGGTSDGVKAAAGTGGVDIRGNITGNLVGTVSTLTTYTGNTPQTGDSFARIGLAGASLTDLGGMSTTMKAQVETEVDDALGGGTGTALTAIPWNASWDAEVQEECADAITAASLPTAAGVWQAITAAAANLIADHVLRRTTANVEASANGDAVSGRSLYGAVARLVHKNTVTAGVLTTTKSDDTTALTTAALTSDANASPITGVDPAA